MSKASESLANKASLASKIPELRFSLSSLETRRDEFIYRADYSRVEGPLVVIMLSSNKKVLNFHLRIKMPDYFDIILLKLLIFLMEKSTSGSFVLILEVNNLSVEFLSRASVSMQRCQFSIKKQHFIKLFHYVLPPLSSNRFLSLIILFLVIECHM